jgi:hypothetical protein
MNNDNDPTDPPEGMTLCTRCGIEWVAEAESLDIDPVCADCALALWAREESD